MSFEFRNRVAWCHKLDHDVKPVILLFDCVGKAFPPPFHQFADFSGVLGDHFLDFLDDSIDLMIVEGSVDNEGRFVDPSYFWHSAVPFGL